MSLLYEALCEASAAWNKMQEDFKNDPINDIEEDIPGTEEAR